MAEEKKYSYGELKLLFSRIEEKLDDIRDDIKENNAASEKRFVQIEHEIALITKRLDKLETFKTKALAYWGMGLTAITIGINKFL